MVFDYVFLPIVTCKYKKKKILLLDFTCKKENVLLEKIYLEYLKKMSFVCLNPQGI